MADERAAPADAVAAPVSNAASADRVFADWEAARRSNPAAAHAAAMEFLGSFAQDPRVGQVQSWVRAYEQVVAQATARAESALATVAVATDGTRVRAPSARIADCQLHVEYAYDTTDKYFKTDIDLRKVDPRAVWVADNQFWKRVALTSRRYEPSCEVTQYRKTGPTEAPAAGDKVATTKWNGCELIVKEDSPAIAAALRTAVESCRPQATAASSATLAEELTPEQAKERITRLLTKEANFSLGFLQTLYISGESLRFEGCTLKARFKTRVSGMVKARNDLLDYVIPFDLVDPGTVAAVERDGKKVATFSALNGSKVIEQDMSYNEGSYEHPSQGQTWSKDFGVSPDLIVDSMENASGLAEAVFHLVKACNANARAAK
ncbi:MAG: hypothetical protein ACM30H_09785 [Clostridia bacterium]